jgi:hypothetical protein
MCVHGHQAQLLTHHFSPRSAAPEARPARNAMMSSAILTQATDK